MARDEKLDLLHRIPLFSGIDRRGLERLGMLSDEIDVPAGKVLMRQGEIGTRHDGDRRRHGGRSTATASA